MGRERKYTVGDYWLARRPDGRSPFWQIRWYDPVAETTRSLSTGCERLEDAKNEIHRYVEDQRSKGPQEADEALVVGVLKRFWEERVVPKVRNKVPFNTSYRAFMGFLMQDAIGPEAVVSDLRAPVWRRFMDWRSKPHSYTAAWAGKTRTVNSKGVCGDSIQRNLSDIQAALEHAVKMDRLPFAPYVPKVDPEDRSPPRKTRLTYQQLGAIVGYALNDLDALRWVLGMLATGCRPDAVLAWNPAEQYRDEAHRLFDTHPHGWPRPKRPRKRYAMVPVIEPFHPWLKAWIECPHKPVKSRKRWWRTMRANLGLPDDIVPKVIRHTIGTELRALKVPPADVKGLLGHSLEEKTTEIYGQYDPTRLIEAKQALTLIWHRVWAEAFIWLSEHYRTTDASGAISVVERKAGKC